MVAKAVNGTNARARRGKAEEFVFCEAQALQGFGRY